MARQHPAFSPAGLGAQRFGGRHAEVNLTDCESGFRLIIARAGDAATFVACGAAAAGIAGSDTLAETALADICQPLDLNLARCRMIVATSVDLTMSRRPLRIAIDGGDKICQPCPSPFCQTRDASAFY